MATFKDAEGREWSIEFDALLLDDIAQKTGIDLADLGGEGLLKIDQHAPSLVKVLMIACRGSLTDKDFSRAMRKDALQSGLRAVLEALENFFPTSAWSGIQSRLTRKKTFAEAFAEIADMPQAAQAAIGEMLQNIDLPALEGMLSAGGQEATPSTSASESQASAE